MKGQALIWSQIRQISRKSGKLWSPVAIGSILINLINFSHDQECGFKPFTSIFTTFYQHFSMTWLRPLETDSMWMTCAFIWPSSSLAYFSRATVMSSTDYWATDYPCKEIRLGLVLHSYGEKLTPSCMGQTFIGKGYILSFPYIGMENLHCTCCCVPPPGWLRGYSDMMTGEGLWVFSIQSNQTKHI